MQTRIRTGSEKDMVTFWRATLETSWRDIPEDERAKLDRMTFESHFRAMAGPYLEDSRNKLFIMEDENSEYLGHILLGKTIPFYSTRTYGFIFDIFVSESARRRGVGSELLRFAMKWFKEQGLSKIKLEVAETNSTAKKLYEKLGFRCERHVLGRSLEFE